MDEELNAEILGRLACLRDEPKSSNPHDAGTMHLWLAFDLGWRDEHRQRAG
jgi:hypothetical protein